MTDCELKAEKSKVTPVSPPNTEGLSLDIFLLLLMHMHLHNVLTPNPLLSVSAVVSAKRLLVITQCICCIIYLLWL